ncbi:MAG TPA: hypothetical protein VE991_08550, partial [Acidimicrobiales bacterium]|nr:hypothetical protein [Acidimicrobiales bacterium]
MATGAPAGAVRTGTVGAELADELPAALLAVTDTTSVRPAVIGVKIRSVAPAIWVHELPVTSHSDHWNEKRIGFEPCQEPGLACRMRPCVGVPTIVGGLVLVGVAAALAREVSPVASASGTNTK